MIDRARRRRQLHDRPQKKAWHNQRHGTTKGVAHHGAHDVRCSAEESSHSAAVATGGDGRPSPGRVAGRSAGRYVQRPGASRHLERPATAEHTGWPASTIASPNDRHLLHRGDDRDVLQRADQPEHERLRISRRRVGIERRVRTGRCLRVRQRVHSEHRRQHVVHSAVPA